MDDEADPEVLAHHEAGHAVMLKVLGKEFSAVTVEGDDTASGRAVRDAGAKEVEAMEGASASVREAQAMEHAIKVPMAGEVAQRMFPADSADDDRCFEPDRRSAGEWMEELVPDPDGQELRDAWLRLLELRTKHLIEVMWIGVQAVAKELSVRKTLSSKEFDKIWFAAWARLS